MLFHIFVPEFAWGAKCAFLHQMEGGIKPLVNNFQFRVDFRAHEGDIVLMIIINLWSDICEFGLSLEREEI